MIKTKPRSTGQPTMTQPEYGGPLIIVDTYKVASLDETEGRRYTTTFNVAQIKLYRNCEEVIQIPRKITMKQIEDR